MKRVFDERVPVTVYLEKAHRDALLREARESGKLFSEYLREKLGDGDSGEAVRRDEPVRLARRSTSAPERLPCKHGAAPGLCRFDECKA